MPGARGHGEDGMSIVELTVVMSMLLLISGSLFSVAVKMSRSEASIEKISNDADAMRSAIARLTREIRGSNPLVVLTPDSNGYQSAYANRLQLELGPAAGPHTYVEWEYASTALKRSVLSGANGSATSTQVIAAGLSTSGSTFRYYRSSSAEMLPPTTLAADIGNCTIRVDVTLKGAPNKSTPITIEQSAWLRNRLPGGIGC